MLNIGNKTFMNLQEAVGWLLENNALPFQSTANYVGNTEIAMSTLVNPSPAKVRVGSLIFFADSKVSTVVGVTSNSFIVSDQYNDLVDDIVYVSNVEINASDHLICTLSNGDSIDAGLIKQVTNFSINGSQHLIANYNDGTSTDLGAIFTGNINVSGNITASGSISAPAITGDSIIENMSGYSFTKGNTANVVYDFIYAGTVKNGNKLTLCVFTKVKRTTSVSSILLGTFDIPVAVSNKLFPTIGNTLSFATLNLAQNYDTSVSVNGVVDKYATQLVFRIYNTSNMTQDVDYYVRFEITFLLSENLVS